MSTEDQKARVDALMRLAEIYAMRFSYGTDEESAAAREALRSALMSNAAPEVDRSAERVETARRNALEEAAKLCEDFAISEDDLDVMAEKIRALADPLQVKETP